MNVCNGQSGNTSRYDRTQSVTSCTDFFIPACSWSYSTDLIDFLQLNCSSVCRREQHQCIISTKSNVFCGM